jgi:hypothetical protein
MLMAFEYHCKKNLLGSQSSQHIPLSGPGQEDLRELELAQNQLKLYHDLHHLEPLVLSFLETTLLNKSELGQTTLSTLLNESWAPFRSLKQSLAQSFVGYFKKRCVEGFKQVRSIPSQYRGTMREPPSKASFFIPLILKPWLSFLGLVVMRDGQETKTDSSSPSLFIDLKKEWSLDLVRFLNDKYLEQLAETLALVKSIEDGLKRFKKKREGPSAQSSSMSDEDKIRSQMGLDIEEWISEVLKLFALLDSDGGRDLDVQFKALRDTLVVL